MIIDYSGNSAVVFFPFSVFYIIVISMRNKIIISSLSLLLLSSIVSCGKKMTGRITFELNGGAFPASFGTNYIEGESGTAILTEIPDPSKSGYYFVGWREKAKDGSYRVINKRTDKDGKSYYFYPYVNDTFYAYFEPLSTITFDLTEGKDVASLVAPKVDSTSFKDGKLNGYASKKLLSVDYLPTVSVVDDGHLTFDYWYTKYPLKGVTDENGQKHYSLDIDGEIGEYEFDRSFGTDNMSFPISDDNNFILYAKWTADPTITVHYNLDGVEDSVFQGKNNISSILISEMLEKIGIDLNAENQDCFYTSDKKKRFRGFYLDSELKTRFNLSSTIADSNVDLYLGWDNQISVTLDYQSGECNGTNMEVFSTEYYFSDVLGEDFYNAHIPTAYQKDFIGYQLDGVSFDVRKDSLPDHDVTLVAVYDDYPTLKLHYDYPDEYTGTKLSDFESKIKSGNNISSIYKDFEEALDDETLVSVGYYKIDGDKEIDLDSEYMPKDDFDVYLKLNYRPYIDIEVYMNVSEDYLKQDDSSEKFFLNDDDVIDVTYLKDRTASIVKDGETYLFDGFYSDIDFSSMAFFPISLSSSHEKVNSRTLYQKMTKAIDVTFVEKSSGQTIGDVKIIPGSKITDSSEVSSLLGEYTKLTLVVDGSEKETQYFPSSSTTIYVYR